MNFGWLRDKRIRFVVQWLPAILGFVATFLGFASQVGYVIAVLFAAIVTLLLWILSNRIVEKAGPQQPASQRMVMTGPALYAVCDVGPYKVEAGENQSVLLNITQGQKLKGHLVEVDNQPFDWYIVDEKNMIRLKNSDEFIYIDEGYDSPAYRVNRKIPYSARWYLIIDLYGKRYSRKVRVDFEHIPVIRKGVPR